jgi:hypothetical protein
MSQPGNVAKPISSIWILVSVIGHPRAIVAPEGINVVIPVATKAERLTNQVTHDRAHRAILPQLYGSHFHLRKNFVSRQTAR